MLTSPRPALIATAAMALVSALVPGCSACDEGSAPDGGLPEAAALPADEEAPVVDDAGTRDASAIDAGAVIDWEVPQTRAVASIDSPSLFMGAMPITTFRAVLGEAELEVTDCYQYAIERQPAYPQGLEQLLLLAGTIKIDVEVGASGAVERAAINKSSAALDGPMQRCVRRAVERLRWPSATATTLATFSVHFTQVPLDDLDQVAPPGAIAPVTLPAPH